MTTILEKLLTEGFRKELDQKKDILGIFPKYGFGSEGWYKTELIHFLDNTDELGYELYQEVRVPLNEKKCIVDIVLVPNTSDPSQLVFIELKHWGANEFMQRTKTFQNRQVEIGNESKWTVRKCLSASKISGLQRMVDLKQELGEAEVYLSILFTEKPSEHEWNKGLQYLEEKFPGHFLPLTNPSTYPEEYFIALLKLSKSK